MKIKIQTKTYDEVIAIPGKTHKKPIKPNMVFRTLTKILSTPAAKKSGLECKKIGMEKLGKDEPCLYLMNHSCFMDFKIAASLLYPRPFNIISTLDGFVGKNWLMRQVGCIPTMKYVNDLTLVRDILYSVRTLKSSVLMYPEASYSMDGTATVLPDSLGKMVKVMKTPVVMIKTYGAFARDPLYNNLQLRKVKISAEMKYLLAPDDIENMTPAEINKLLREEFTFDNFKWQQENKVKIDEPFRADGLNRVLYKCPKCNAEGKTVGKGKYLVCKACGKKYELTEYGYMKALDGETEFSHIPDWYNWQRQCVKDEIESGSYRLDVKVDIKMLVNSDALYDVGTGILTHGKEGFHLVSDDGKIDYTQKPLASYTLNADYFWYEQGDVICIGNQKGLYYCFPKDCGDIVAKTKLATEELYKIAVIEKKNAKEDKKEADEKSE
jgi:1-acyl-sn-glycerol-3-phosphate acyltransferase